MRGKDSNLGHLLEPGSGLEAHLSVGVTTLGDFVFVEGYQAPSFVKLDVEGAESRVLSGGLWGQALAFPARSEKKQLLTGEEQGQAHCSHMLRSGIQKWKHRIS